jgi:phosphopantetheine--protein transferase-like protein
MTSSTWSCEPGLTLKGIGIDIENIARFERFDPASGPMPFVFTSGELAAAQKAKRPSEHLCIVFAAKEALRKALGAPYDYVGCEVTAQEGEAILSLGGLAAEHEIGATRVRVVPSDLTGDELCVEVYLFAKGESTP